MFGCGMIYIELLPIIFTIIMIVVFFFFFLPCQKNLFYKQIDRIRGLEKENDYLKKSLDALDKQIDRMRAIERVNDYLKKSLDTLDEK